MVQGEKLKQGERLIQLFVFLMFSGLEHSLTELSEKFNCSKQTVIRDILNIESSYGIRIKIETRGREHYYKMSLIDNKLPLIPLTSSELSVLHMCSTFTKHLIGDNVYSNAVSALEKKHANAEQPFKNYDHFATLKYMSVDYSNHNDVFEVLGRAMNEFRVCRMEYRKLGSKKSGIYYIKPLKIFSHKDSVYLHARRAKEPGKKYIEPKYDTTFAIHRIRKIETTESIFEYPKDYDFETFFNDNFCLMKNKKFDAEIEFTGFAAAYISERVWSVNQEITPVGDNKIRIKLSASSEYEFLSWILSFGNNARLLKPDYMVEKIRQKIDGMTAFYENTDCSNK